VTFFADLTPYRYLEDESIRDGSDYLVFTPRYELLNVGWLDPGHPYEEGPVPDDFPAALLAVVDGEPVNLTRGYHYCEICGPSADVRGNGEIRVPARPGVMFAAPVLIGHYVTAHSYRPPDEFIAAVRDYDPGWRSEPGPWIPPDAERM